MASGWSVRGVDPGGSAGRSDAGVHSVEALMVIPLVLVVVLGTIQVALWAVGRNMARNAANGAVVVASLEGGTQDQAVAEATSRLGQSDLLGDREVSVSTTGGDVRATVSVTVVSLVPGIPVRATVTSVVPVERWTEP